jgi:hypothetical protein
MSNKKVINKKVERDQLITILRKPSGLVAVINRPKHDFTMSLWDPEKNNCFEELDDFYETFEAPVETISPSLVSRKNKLVNCWNRLSNDQEMGPHTLFSIMRLLIETQHHPEAIQTPRSTNFNNLLCDAKSRNTLLWKMRYLWNDASKILSSSGYNTQSIDTIFNGSPVTHDPFYLYHFDQITKFTKLPDLFRISILPLLKNQRWKVVTEWLGLYRALELEQHSNLLHSVSRLIRVAEESIARNWCNLILSSPPNRRAAFVAIINETRFFRWNPAKLSSDVIQRFFEMTTKKQLPERLCYFLKAVEKNISIDYLFAGFRLANRYCPQYLFNEFNNCKHFPYDDVVEIFNRIRSKYASSREFALMLWEECGRMAGFSELIQNPGWKQIGVVPAARLLRICTKGLIVSRSESIKDRLLTKEIIPNFLQLVKTEIPKKYRIKFCDRLNDLAWEWFSIDKLIEWLPRCAQALQRFCVPPFDKVKLNTFVLLTFIKRSEKLWTAFLAAPQSSFVALEKACSSSNDCFLIERGVRTLLRNAPLFTIKSFHHFPRKLFHVAKTLGVYRYPVRVRATKDFLETPIMGQRFRKLSLHQAADLIKGSIKPRITNPIPKMLTKFLSGEYCLTPARKRRYKKIMFENLNLTRLELLEEFLCEKLKTNYPGSISDDRINHALQLLQLIKINRRQMKRYLSCYFRGNQNYVIEHPRTQQWIATHSTLDLSIWQKGIQFEKQDHKLGKICIQAETDPLEILKMGTYVGSCLGLGGVNAFSAASVMLDINKQVLYARTQDGKILARQLVAFSEDNKLVCFSVYPIGTSKELKRLFSLYDRNFAKALGVPICVDWKKYQIKNVLSQDWYDDYAWNLKD